MIFLEIFLRAHEAEIVLLNDHVIETKSRDVAEDVTFNFQDTACFALQILAKIFSKTERVPKANEADRKALKLNPLLWESFESLCQRGDYIDTNVVFNIEKLDELSHCQGNNHIISYVSKTQTYKIFSLFFFFRTKLSNWTSTILYSSLSSFIYRMTLQTWAFLSMVSWTIMTKVKVAKTIRMKRTKTLASSITR